MHIDRYTYNLL